jgi:hypothetical protein
MITDRDIAVRTVAAGRGPDTPVREAMTDHVDYGFDDEEVEAVAIKMSDAQVRRLPVISRDEKKLVGIVSPAISAAPTKARLRASRWAASPIPVGSTTSRPSSAERPMAERRRARDVCGGEIVLRRPWQRPVFGAGLAAFTVLGAILAVGLRQGVSGPRGREAARSGRCVRPRPAGS